MGSKEPSECGPRRPFFQALSQQPSKFSGRNLEKVRVFIEGTVTSHQSSPGVGEIWKKFEFIGRNCVNGVYLGVIGGEKGKRPVGVTRVKGSKKFLGKNGEDRRKKWWEEDIYDKKIRI